MTHQAMQHRTTTMNACIEQCTKCHATCLETLTGCLAQGGEHAQGPHVALMATCADICATSADAMLRGAAVHTVICGACATVCRQCAQSCASFGDDAEMALCAEACRRCAESCEAMAA